MRACARTSRASDGVSSGRSATRRPPLSCALLVGCDMSEVTSQMCFLFVRNGGDTSALQMRCKQMKIASLWTAMLLREA